MKILIADDDADDRVFASMALTEINPAIEVEFAVDGQEMINQLNTTLRQKSRLPDLILLDLNMPRKDGRAALCEIKNNQALRHLRVIIFSTSGSESDKKFTLEHGAEQYIVKPSNYEQLLDIFTGISEKLFIYS